MGRRATPRRWPRELRALAPPLDEVAPQVAAIVARRARARRRGGARADARFDATERAPERLRVDAGAASSAALAALEPEVREALELAAREHPRRRRGRSSRRAPPTVELPAGPDGRRRARCRSAPAGVYAPGGRAAYPSIGPDVLRSRPAWRASSASRSPRPPGADGHRERRRPRGLRGLRGRRGLRDGRRPGDRRARLRHRDRSRRST